MEVILTVFSPAKKKTPGGVTSHLPNPGHSRRVWTAVDGRLERQGRSRGLTERSCTWKNFFLKTDINHKTRRATPAQTAKIKLRFDTILWAACRSLQPRSLYSDAGRHHEANSDSVRRSRHLVSALLCEGECSVKSGRWCDLCGIHVSYALKGLL